MPPLPLILYNKNTMISRNDLRKIIKGRLKDSEVLLAGKRYDGAIYLCGYAVEMALKLRICQTLKWQSFPETPGEFSDLKSFQIHDLERLLRLTGRVDVVKPAYMTDWSIVLQWDQNARYKVPGSATRTDAVDMLNAAKTIIRVL
jgi:hypothetical protein